MASIKISDIRHIAKLANLSLSKSQESRFFTQINSVIEHINVLCEVDTSNVEPTSQTTGLENIYREDNVDAISMLKSNQVTSGTDKIYNNFFVVDMILSEKI
ncbi:MAG: Asp-tRNA(Asn)/Glu-tRNA(Gln) amidotransferase subunit GatC [Patescibacteria group bacterium]|nr:Asp-tRNA(Asn)/Glu-tRNA(Gln) amidotransferase subunit GatC [Patescibacteria group bacterium]